MNNLSDKFLIFDIETAAQPEAVMLLPEPTAPKNYGLEAAEKYIKMERERQVKQAALDPDACKIVALGLRHGVDGLRQSYVVGVDMSLEETLLSVFWEHYCQADGYLAGYNIMGFDLPVILRRMFAYQMAVPARPQLRLARYKEEPICDLMMILCGWDLSKARSLKWLVQRYGIPNPLPDEDGSKVAEMDSDRLRAYVENDVELETALYKRMAPIYMPHHLTRAGLLGQKGTPNGW